MISAAVVGYILSSQFVFFNIFIFMDVFEILMYPISNGADVPAIGIFIS